MIIFYRPQYLILLFLIPIIIFIHINSLRTAKRKAIKFANFDAIKKIEGVELFSKNLTILYLTIAILTLIILSISGLSMTRQVDASKLSFVIAIDDSRSMGASDISPTRLDAAKKAALDFLNMVPVETRTGVLAFGSDSVIQQEVTDDKQAVRNAIKNIELTPAGGTDALTAIITSSNLLVGEEARAIVIMSDGGLNVNSIQSILDYVNKNKITVYSLGIGTSGGGSDASGATYPLTEEIIHITAKSIL